jgi:tetratricopeptide (TPR) repeat protein
VRFLRRGHGNGELPVSELPVPAEPDSVAPLSAEADEAAAAAADAEADAAEADEAEADAAEADAALGPVGGEQVAPAELQSAAVVRAETAGFKPVELSSLERVAAEVAGTDADVEPDDAVTADDASADGLVRAETVAETALWPDADAATEPADDAAAWIAAEAAARIAADRAFEDSDATIEPGAPGADTESDRARVVFWRAADTASLDESTVEGRSPALRFAGLHLRGGQHALARAELEALAGRGRLDEPALLDLAEIRWRTGDLAGAGDAANAFLARGNESPLALLIAAEAVAAVGRPGEARRLSLRALEVADGPLDPLFAGMPRSTFWPAPESDVAAVTPRRRGRNRAGDTSGAPSTASEAFAGGRAALARGDSTRAALLLGVAMRLAPEFAEDVLHAVTRRDDQPLLALVHGDALRLLGREAEALEAFDRARGRASATGVGGPSHEVGPGLFDDDPAISGDEEA